ncbi:MAG: hypothetical protein AAF250_14390 [Pseudomonadota bacterium]
MSDPYDELFRAIGRTVYEWSWLESDIAHFVFDLTACHSAAFYDDSGVSRVSALLHANISLRTNIEIAKSLAYSMDGPEGFFDRVEKSLNIVANDLRNERNRYAHDLWYMAGSGSVRLKPGSKFKREKGTGETNETLASEERFTDVAQVHDLANRIHNKRKEVMALSSEAQEHYRRRNPSQE